MNIVNDFKSNYNLLIQHIDMIEKTNIEYKEKIKQLESDYNDLNKVSKIREYDKQLFELKRENEFLKNQLEKAKNKIQPINIEKKYSTIMYKNINYLMDDDTKEIFTINNNVKDVLVARLVNGKFKKISV